MTSRIAAAIKQLQARVEAIEARIGHYGGPKANVNDLYLTARQVRQRYGNASDMWLHRRLHDDSGFPRPDLVVNGRRFWRVSSLVRWERKRVTAGVR